MHKIDAINKKILHTSNSGNHKKREDNDKASNNPEYYETLI